MNLPLNSVPGKASIKDLLDLWKRDVFLSLNCHAIGTIKSFDPATQRATATVDYTKTYLRPPASGASLSTGDYGPTQVAYPPLTDAPVIFLGGGGGRQTFPVGEGDECLILFNDRDLDNWNQGSKGGAVASTRLHSFADGVIVVGLRSLPNVLTDFDPSRAVIALGANARLAVGSDAAALEYGQALGAAATFIRTTSAGAEVNGGGGKVNVSNSAGNTLGALLGQLTSQLQSLTTQLSTLCTDIAAITVTCSAPGVASSPPLNAAAVTAVQTQISSTGSQIGTIASSLSGLLT